MFSRYLVQSNDPLTYHIRLELNKSLLRRWRCFIYNIGHCIFAMWIDFYWQFDCCYAWHNTLSRDPMEVCRRKFSNKNSRTGFSYGIKKEGLFLLIKTMYALYDVLKETNDEHEFVNLVHNIQYEFHRLKVLYFTSSYIHSNGT